MGDSQNDVQHSKKRAAGVQLTRDNPGLDDDDESSEQASGTFKRASDEVLATRRIVKVRRQQTPSVSAAPDASAASNPFSAVRLLPASATTPQVVTVEERANGGDKKIGDSSELELPNAVSGAVNEKTEITENSAKPSETPEGHVSSEKDEAAGASEQEGVSNANQVSEDKEPEDGAGKSEDADLNVDETKVGEGDVNKDGGTFKEALEAERSEENKSLSSFGNLSSRQNAFSGLSGTGFSGTSFSFGSIPKDGAPGSFSFGASTNGDASIFETAQNGPSLSEAGKITPLQEIPVETGEENENTVFSADSALYEFLDGSWKERGKGELKLNLSTEGTPKARLVMRTKGNLRVILNASLFPDMKMTAMDKRGISFACVNSINEGKHGLSTYALKFRNPSIVENFEAAVTKYKCEVSAAPQTPENSPKATV